MAAWESAPIVKDAGQPAWMSAPLADQKTKSKPKDDTIGLGPIANTIAGGLRGVKDVIDTGAQLLASGFDKLAGTNEGDRVRALNQAGKAEFDATLGDSTAAKVGRVGGNIAATLPVGGVVAAPLKVGAALGVAPRVLAPLADAAASGGMTAGGLTGKTAMAARVAGGGATGGASAAAVDPESAGAGAAIGAALPPLLKVAGAAGAKAGAVIAGPAQSAEKAAAVQAARDAGYVIPPTQANPTLANRLLEGFAGKVSTAQNASAANQGVTNKLAARSLGLAENTTITPKVLEDLRTQAGQAYADLGATGVITPGEAYGKALDKIAQPFKLTAEAFPNAKQSPVLELVDSMRSPAFASASAVEKIKQLRTAADDAYRAGNTDVGRAAKAAAKALENAVEEHVVKFGDPGLLKSFRDARELIAKTYSVEKALNVATGSVDAKSLGAQLAKGKPLSGDLEKAAQFGLSFKKAAQTPEQMGSLPQLSPLDWAFGGSMAAGMGNPLFLAGVAGRPMARKLTMSDLMQNRLVQQPSTSRLGDLLTSDAATAALYRGAPVLPANGR